MKQIMSRRQCLHLGLAVGAAPSISRTAFAAPYPVLVELFTSQGCSSCPPADRVLGDIKDDPNIYAVSFNVDYWDYLGWRDTLAKPEYTARQKAYAWARADGQVYTPQMVINGWAHVVGSRRGDVEAAISAAERTPIAMQVEVEGGELVLALDRPAPAGATLWLMGLEREVEQKIDRGENTGASVTYHNVVRKLVNAGLWDPTESSKRLRLKHVEGKTISDVIVVLQSGEAGRVLGLARFSLPKA